MKRTCLLIATLIVEVIWTGNSSIESRQTEDLTWDSANSDAIPYQDENKIIKTY